MCKVVLVCYTSDFMCLIKMKFLTRKTSSSISNNCLSCITHKLPYSKTISFCSLKVTVNTAWIINHKVTWTYRELWWLMSSGMWHGALELYRISVLIFVVVPCILILYEVLFVFTDQCTTYLLRSTLKFTLKLLLHVLV